MPEKQPDIFRAIADPTRRRIIHLLVLSGALSLGSIAERFAMSRQAVTKHLKLLSEANVLTIDKVGRQQMCEVNAQALKEVYDWVAFYKEFWDEKLDALDAFLHEKHGQKKDS